MYLQTLLLVFLLSLAYGQDRRIISKLNPGCQTCDVTNTLVYIEAIGNHDTIHQIWDFTRGIPTVIYAIANLNSSMQIIWRDSEPVRFNMSEPPIYSFAAAIDQVYEYDDCKNNGHMNITCPTRPLSLQNMSWKLVDSVLTDNEKEAMIRMHGFYRDRVTTGIIDMKLDLLPFQDYAVDLPHLIHTANSTLVDVSLINFTTTLNASRFALHFVMVSTDAANDTMDYTMRKSLDDEHTPGVFEIIEIKTPKCRVAQAGGFMQFRPVSYTEAVRTVSSSTNAYISNFNRTRIPARSTLWTFYKEFDRNNLLVQDMVISFGIPGDGYYIQHNYTSWSFTYGYGAPPVEGVSLFVIIIIAIGLGVPVLLAISGITYVLVKRHKHRNQPVQFSDEE